MGCCKTKLFCNTLFESVEKQCVIKSGALSCCAPVLVRCHLVYGEKFSAEIAAVAKTEPAADFIYRHILTCKIFFRFLQYQQINVFPYRYAGICFENLLQIASGRENSGGYIAYGKSRRKIFVNTFYRLFCYFRVVFHFPPAFLILSSFAF